MKVRKSSIGKRSIGKVKASCEDITNVCTRSTFPFISFLNQFSPTGKNIPFFGQPASIKAITRFNQF